MVVTGYSYCGSFLTMEPGWLLFMVNACLRLIKEIFLEVISINNQKSSTACFFNNSTIAPTKY